MKNRITLLIAGFLAATAATAQVTLVEYDWRDTPTANKLDPDTLAAGVSATDMAEIGDVDGQAGISNFSGNSLTIKRNALDSNLSNSNNSLTFTLSATNPGEVLDVDTLDMTFNSIGGNDLFSFEIFADAGSGEQSLFTTGPNLENFANTSQSYDVSTVANSASIDFRIEYASASTGAANYSLQTANIGVTGVTAIPEPSSYALLGGLGALALAVVRRRRIGS